MLEKILEILFELVYSLSDASKIFNFSYSIKSIVDFSWH